MTRSRWRSSALALVLAPALALAGGRGGHGPPAPSAGQRAGAPGAPAGPVLRAALGRPVLELLEPQVDQSLPRLTLRARNRGQADLPASALAVRYRVEGVVRGPAQPIAEGTFVAENVALPVGATAVLGGVVLPDRRRALSFEHVTVNVALAVAGPSAVEPTSASFPLRWRTRTAVLDARALRAAGMGWFRLRLNGYDAGAVPLPAAREACLVAVGAGGRDAALRFGLPPGGPVPAGAGSSFLVLVNATGGESRGERALLVEDGRLTLRVEVAGRGSDGFKAGVLAAGRFDDAALPDLALAPFPVTAVLALGIDRQRAALCVVGASVEASPRASDPPGHLAGVAPAAEAAVQGMRAAIVQGVTSLLARPDARSVIEDLLARALAASGPISALYAIDGRGQEIVVTCA